VEGGETLSCRKTYSGVERTGNIGALCALWDKHCWMAAVQFAAAAMRDRASVLS
jgi:hypothetical protein